MLAEGELGGAGALPQARMGEEGAQRHWSELPPFLPELLALNPHPQPGAGSGVSAISNSCPCRKINRR